MAYIRKLTSGNYQVQIRRADLKTISKTFKLKKDASLFAAQVEADESLAHKLGDPISNGTTLAGLIDDFTEYYKALLISGDKKDPNIITRLAFWNLQYGAVTQAQHYIQGMFHPLSNISLNDSF